PRRHEPAELPPRPGGGGRRVGPDAGGRDDDGRPVVPAGRADRHAGRGGVLDRGGGHARRARLRRAARHGRVAEPERRGAVHARAARLARDLVHRPAAPRRPRPRRDELHEMTATPNADVLRELLVSDLLRAAKIHSPRVAEAFRAVPRHRFVPDVPVETAYEDDVIFTKSRDGVSVSALPSPSISADMLEALDVRPGHAVLEIGAGTGYNAALLAELAAPGGRVVTIDIDQDIVDAAVSNLRAAGVLDRVHVYCADGGFGRSEEAPYDRVLVTVGAWDV